MHVIKKIHDVVEATMLVSLYPKLYKFMYGFMYGSKKDKNVFLDITNVIKRSYRKERLDNSSAEPHISTTTKF